jgi:predicted peroxiredoxin
MEEKNLRGRRRILYVLTKGIEDPEIAYIPFLLATSAAAMDSEASIFFIGEGVTVLKNDVTESVRVGNLPPLRFVIEQALQAGVGLEVCDESCMIRGLVERDLIDNATIIGATTLNDRMIQSDKIISF